MLPQLLDIGGPELLVLIMGAVIIFGPNRLPDFVKKAANIVRYVRTMATDAQGKLTKELGPEFENFDFRDLNPKQFVQKHLFEDVEPLVADVKKELSGAAAVGTAAAATAKAAASSKGVSKGGPTRQPALAAVAAKSTPWDPDAT